MGQAGFLPPPHHRHPMKILAYALCILLACLGISMAAISVSAGIIIRITKLPMILAVNLAVIIVWMATAWIWTLITHTPVPMLAFVAASVAVVIDFKMNESALTPNAKIMMVAEIILLPVAGLLVTIGSDSSAWL